MVFTCVYTKTAKKLQKFIKVNKIKNKYILDIKKMMEDEEIGEDKMYLKILILNKVHLAIEKNKDIYFIPNFDDEFSIEKLLNLKQILENNKFNILMFFDDFNEDQEVLDDAFKKLSVFDSSQIIRDY
jgi:argonaute-like protein implicated in RNA metabolism and viral defense